MSRGLGPTGTRDAVANKGPGCPERKTDPAGGKEEGDGAPKHVHLAPSGRDVHNTGTYVRTGHGRGTCKLREAILTGGEGGWSRISAPVSF